MYWLVFMLLGQVLSLPKEFGFGGFEEDVALSPRWEGLSDAEVKQWIYS